MKYPIHIEGIDTVFYCDEKDSILTGLLKSSSKGIQVGCRGGGCGVCKIRIDSGHYVAGTMSVGHVSAEQREQGEALACKVYPRGEIHLSVLGKVRRKIERAA